MKLRGKLPFCILLLLVLPLFVIGMWAAVPYPTDTQSDGMAPASPPASAPDSAHGAQVDAPKLLTGIFNELPDGRRIEGRDFAAAFSPETAGKLHSAGITSISRHGGHVELELSQPFQHTVNSKLEARLETSLSFDVTPGADSMEFHNIAGIKLHVNWFLGWMDLTDLTMRKDQQGNTELVAEVKIWFMKGKTSYSVTLGPDGKPLPKKM